MPMPTSSIGECEPEVTSPPPSIDMPCRGIALSVHDEGDEPPFGPLLLDRAQLSTPVKSVSSAHTQPSPAEIASVSGEMSLPCSGKQTSSRSVSRAPSPHGIAPRATTASQSAGASSAGHISSTPSSPV